MTYVHFDLAEYEQALRQVRDATLPIVIAQAKSDRERDGYLVQDRFFDAQLAALIEMMRLLNEGRSADYVGRAVGQLLGNIGLNTLAASEDPSACHATMAATIEASLQHLAGATPAGFHVGQVTLNGTKGGRA